MRSSADLSFLRKLQTAKSSRKRKQLVRKATPTDIKSVSEVCLNLLRGRVPLSSATVRRLRRHRCTIRELGSRKVSLKRKKRLLVQKGSGFLLPLLGAAIPIITSLLRPRQ